MTKESVRHLALAARLGVDTCLLEEKSNVICCNFYKSFSDYSTFLMYWPIKSEVNVLPLIDKMHKDGKCVYLPCVNGNNISFRMFEGVSKLIKGSFNIYEPLGEPLDRDVDIMVVPALAYDMACFRLGYGKGFYDRFIASGCSGIKVGLAYDFQIVDTVYPEGHDKPVDIIFTEKQIIRRI